MGSLANAMVVFWVIGLVVAIAWIILPFAMIGMKPLLRELIKEARDTNALLRSAQNTLPK